MPEFRGCLVFLRCSKTQIHRRLARYARRYEERPGSESNFEGRGYLGALPLQVLKDAPGPLRGSGWGRDPLGRRRAPLWGQAAPVFFSADAVLAESVTRGPQRRASPRPRL